MEGSTTFGIYIIGLVNAQAHTGTFETFTEAAPKTLNTARCL
jgi:hypothetical protein